MTPFKTPSKTLTYILESVAQLNAKEVIDTSLESQAAERAAKRLAAKRTVVRRLSR